MRAKRILGGVLAVLAVLLLAIVLTVLFWLGPVVKRAAEMVGTKALGVPVSVGHLSINPCKGTLSLSGFAIGNPEGYGRSNTVSLARLDIDLDIASVFSGTVTIHRVQVESPRFTYEQNGAEDNISRLVANLQAFAGGDAAEEKSPKAAKDAKGEPKQVVVEALEINDIELHLAHTGDPLLDVQAGLARLALSTTNGTVRLERLAIGNPGRLATTNLFTLEAIELRIDPASIHSGKPSIQDVRISKPHAFLELNPETGTVAEWMQIAARLAGREAPPSAPPHDAPPPGPRTAPPIEWQHLAIDDIQVLLLDTTRTNAPAALHRLASVDAISASLAEGRIHIGGLAAPNLPEGFATTNLLAIAGIDIAFDPASLFTQQPVVREILVDSPTVNIEQTPATGNVHAMLHLAGLLAPPAPAGTAAAEAPEREEPAPPGGDPPLLVESIVVSNFVAYGLAPATTNQLLSGALGTGVERLQRLNPVSRGMIERINPLQMVAGRGDASAPDADGPLILAAFDRLVAEPPQGVLEITNLQLGNPNGFADQHLAQIDRFRIEIDPATIHDDILLVRSILIERPRIAYERQLATDNIKALQAFYQAVGQRREQMAPDEDADGPVAEAAGPNVVVEHLLVDQGLVRATISTLPTTPVPLPRIEMRDIGKETGGTTLGNALSRIGGSFYDAIIGSVAGATGLAGDALKGAGSLAIGTLGDVAGAIGAATGSAPPEEPGEERREEPPPKRRTRVFNKRPGSPF